MNNLNNLPTQLHSASLAWATPNGDNQIAYLARMSAPKNQQTMQALEETLKHQEEGSKYYLEAQKKLNELTSRLIHFCIKEGHVSILETANMCLTIKTTLDIATQILRHRSFTFQQFSQRYAPVADSLTMPEPRGLDGNHRNPSVPVEMPDDTLAVGQELLRVSEVYYRKLLKLGYHPEFARKFLPQQTPTYLAMNGTVRSWFFYLKQRTDKHAQYEHQLVAESALEVFKEQFPLVYSAYL